MPTLPAIVVPDGLAADRATGATLERPSFVYRTVLDRAAERYRDCRILLAPANSFGGPCSEQAAAASYLKEQGVSHAEAFEVSGRGHIDTFGNATHLKAWLAARGEWPFGPAILIAASRHAPRAALCFRRNGFDIADVDAVAYDIGDEPIVTRLFYYRYPPIHAAYEALATLRDRLRPVTQR